MQRAKDCLDVAQREQEWMIAAVGFEKRCFKKIVGRKRGSALLHARCSRDAGKLGAACIATESSDGSALRYGYDGPVVGGTFNEIYVFVGSPPCCAGGGHAQFGVKCVLD